MKLFTKNFIAKVCQRFGGKHKKDEKELIHLIKKAFIIQGYSVIETEEKRPDDARGNLYKVQILDKKGNIVREVAGEIYNRTYEKYGITPPSKHDVVERFIVTLINKNACSFTDLDYLIKKQEKETSRKI